MADDIADSTGGALPGTTENAGSQWAGAATRTPYSGAEATQVDEPSQPGFQRVFDKIVTKAILWAVPTWVKPNHVTVLRLLFIPAILLLLYFDHRVWALVLFAVAIWTDPIDGAMARTRGQTSTFGTYVDPIADKLLVAAVLAWVGWRYLVVQILLALIALELVVTAVGVPMLVRSQSSQQSNVFGKVKMFVQSLALFLFLLAAILGLDALTRVCLYMLWVALAFVILSGAKQVYDVLRKRRRS
jgi:CDP-diacylglycerol--glycerol-3-phosphate 3-phosphatidyltransferase